MKVYLIIVVIVFSMNKIFCQDNIDFKKMNPFTDFGKNSLYCFEGNNLYYHLAGIASAGLIIYSGADTKVHNFFVENTLLDDYSTPGVYIGYLMPVVLGGSLMAYGAIDNSSKEYAAGCAALQSAGIAFAYTCILKAITGRPNPEPLEYTDNNASQKFRFGFMNGGIHYGWPSGHLLTNTAIATSLMYFYKDNAVINGLSIGYIAYIFVSVLVHEKQTMHWFSDIVSGTLMGWAIGSTVGTNYRNLWDEGQKPPDSNTFRLIPNIQRIEFVYHF